IQPLPSPTIFLPITPPHTPRPPPFPYTTLFRSQKDMNLALELGRELDVPLPTTAITNELLTAARALGLEDKDFAVVFEVLARMRSEEHTSELQSQSNLVCRLLLEKKKQIHYRHE